MGTLLPLLLLLIVAGDATFLWRVSGDADAGDAAAMRDLAASTGADRILSWSTATDPCDWDGVRCDIAGRVVAVQAGGKGLSGKLPPSLTNLTSLTRLELQANRLSGDLSPLSPLSQLQLLFLHGNLFTSIPPTFFDSLASMQHIYLDHNPLAPWAVPPSLAGAAGLLNFSAVNTSLSGAFPALFVTAFPSLDHLALSYNFLSGRLPPELAGSSLRSLWLNNQRGEQRLTGSIAVVANMTTLEELWLSSNEFTGPVPDLSGLPALRDLQLRDNTLSGPLPPSLILSTSLKKITLTNNLLQGPVPVFSKNVALDLVVSSNSFCLSEPGTCDPRVDTLISISASFGYPQRFAAIWKGNDPCIGWLGITCDDTGNVTIVNFHGLGLSGSISTAFTSLGTLQRLILSGNNVSGSIPPELTGIPSLRVFDVSNNQLSGEVPRFHNNVLLNTMGNPNIGKDIAISTPEKNPSGSSSRNSSSSNHRIGGGLVIANKRKSNAVGIILGSVIGSLFLISIGGLLGYCYHTRRQQQFMRVQSPNTVIHPRHSGSGLDTVKITMAGSSGNGASVSSDAFSRMSSGPGDVHSVDAGNMVISIQVLRDITNNFSEDNVLGSGGFGTVYKGELHDGTKIAVKRMEAAVMGTKGLNEFKSEIAVLTKVRHRNLVSLLGYCLDGNERLLVYEYMPQGALSKHLFDWKDAGFRPIEWKKRLSTALDVARGVEYLHSLAHQSFIHRDLKPSNILLGDDMKAKVADFGLVRLAPDGKCSLVETRLAGTFGYLAPEYAVTGRVTTKADVFSFGVILMELITGRKALDETQPEESVHLVTWFRPVLQLDQDTFCKAIDPTIDLDEETLASISTVAELAGHCCAREPHQRPDMGHAVNVLSSLAELWRPVDPDSDDDGYGIDLDMTLPQALQKWQALEDSQMSSLDNTQTSIPTRPPGLADSFSSADAR